MFLKLNVVLEVYHAVLLLPGFLIGIFCLEILNLLSAVLLVTYLIAVWRVQNFLAYLICGISIVQLLLGRNCFGLYGWLILIPAAVARTSSPLALLSSEVVAGQVQEIDTLCEKKSQFSEHKMSKYCLLPVCHCN